MERLRQAVSLAKVGDRTSEKTSDASPLAEQLRAASSKPDQKAGTETDHSGGSSSQDAKIVLDNRHLEASRIISHDISDPRSKSYDILRTQVLQSMDLNKWQFLAVTSPTASCGKSVTACNLAVSIARQADRSVLLVDLDLRRPEVASALGLKCDKGVLGVLEGRIALADAVIEAYANNYGLMVLPVEVPTSASSEWMTSRNMSKMLLDIKKDYQSYTVIFDMPPMLTSDDVIAILPKMDCVVLVAGVGTTTVSEIEECNGHLHSSELIRLVLNKAPGLTAKYY